LAERGLEAAVEAEAEQLFGEWGVQQVEVAGAAALGEVPTALM
jgi:hypothetical protein